jgi:REP element-mobilizing transposase RayT
MWSSERLNFRVVHYAVMRDHVHMIVEANDRIALARGMQGLGIRIARRLNRLMERSGRILSDRYHAHILRTPTETKHARHYLLTNARHHYKLEGPDPYASTIPLVLPETFFLHQLE